MVSLMAVALPAQVYFAKGSFVLRPHLRCNSATYIELETHQPLRQNILLFGYPQNPLALQARLWQRI